MPGTRLPSTAALSIIDIHYRSAVAFLSSQASTAEGAVIQSERNIPSSALFIPNVQQDLKTSPSVHPLVSTSLLQRFCTSSRDTSHQHVPRPLSKHLLAPSKRLPRPPRPNFHPGHKIPPQINARVTELRLSVDRRPRRITTTSRPQPTLPPIFLRPFRTD